VGAPEEINRIFSHLKYSEEKHFRGDSAYCNEEVIRACIKQGAHFTVTAHGSWERQLSAITNWTPWQFSLDEIKWATAKKRSLPEIEVGSFQIQLGWSDTLRFQVVVKRTRID